ESATAPVAIDIGVPLVFDVVDLDPAIERDGPTSFPFGVTVVRWRATDASGNPSPWVDQRITVKPVGSNSVPVAADTMASAISFEETTVVLHADDADGDHLFFYIDREPDEGFFVAPLLPVFVEDLRVQRQVTLADLQTHCATVNAPLPPQNFVYKPQYVTVDDEGTSFVIDRELYCFGSSLPRSLADRARIARISADRELLGQYLFTSSTTITKLSFHPGGLPGYEQPFVYWVDRGTERLLVLEQSLSGPVEVIRLDLLPPGTIPFSNYVDAAIDSQGIAYVTNTNRVYAYDFLTRPAGGSNGMRFLGRLGAPASQSQGDFGQAWDMDIDSQDHVHVSDWDRNRIHKFGASTLERVDGGADVFTSGDYIGWLGACSGDSAPGGAAVCNVALGRSFGYSCTDATCSASPTFGSAPGQFSEPQGFAIDPNDILYIADRGNNRIQRFTPEGLFAGQAKSDCSGVNCFIIGQFGTAMDVSVNSTSFFVLDEDTDILHIFSTNPVTMTGPTSAEVTYRSFNNFIGIDTFDFYASDGLRVDGDLVRSNVATASILVERNFRPPFATAGIVGAGDEDTQIPILLDGSDPDIGSTYPWEPLDTLSFAVSTPPAHGSVSIAGDIATYTPDPDWNGIDSFHFTVSDGMFTSAPEEVVITVHPINDPPELTAPANPQTAGLGFSYALSIEVRDPDELDEHTVEVDWGDGTVESEGEILPDGTITGPLIDFNPGGDGLITAQHVYTQLGTRSLQACATDAVGASGCVAFDVDVVAMTDLNVFETVASPTVQPGQPVLFTIAVSNFAPETGAGMAATGGVLDIDIDPRLSILAVNPGTGVNCTGSGAQRTCTLPSLSPIARGNPDDPPPADRQIGVTAILAEPLPPGTLLRSRAEVAASEPNRSPLNRVVLDRHVV
ncbi:MAG TPA: Ig-like domain-containing protein, partial [Xanthomonadaceae bacterium]|nr:Ig-like domain-containing protein [Xanthomonadaceae bacterium]